MEVISHIEYSDPLIKDNVQLRARFAALIYKSYENPTYSFAKFRGSNVDIMSPRKSSSLRKRIKTIGYCVRKLGSRAN